MKSDEDLAKCLPRLIPIDSAVGILLIGLTVALVSIRPLYQRLQNEQTYQLAFAVQTRLQTTDPLLARFKGIGSGTSAVAGGKHVGDAGEVFDSGRFRSNRGEEDLMKELIGFFDVDAEMMLGEIDPAAAGGDADKLHRAAHGLMGMVGNYCVSSSCGRAGDPDARGRSGETDAAVRTIPGRKRELERLREALHESRDDLKEI